MSFDIGGRSGGNLSLRPELIPLEVFTFDGFHPASETAFLEHLMTRRPMQFDSSLTPFSEVGQQCGLLRRLRFDYSVTRSADRCQQTGDFGVADLASSFHFRFVRAFS